MKFETKLKHFRYFILRLMNNFSKDIKYTVHMSS